MSEAELDPGLARFLDHGAGIPWHEPIGLVEVRLPESRAEQKKCRRYLERQRYRERVKARAARAPDVVKADLPSGPEHLVQGLRRKLEAVGGVWPQGFDQVAADLVIDATLRRGAGGASTAAPVRLFLQLNGGVFLSTKTELGRASYCARESISRTLPKMPDVHVERVDTRLRFTLSS